MEEDRDFYSEYEVYAYRDSEYWHSKVMEDENPQENEENVNHKFLIKCPNCGFIYNDDEKPKDFKGKEIDLRNYVLLNDPGKFRCPNCFKVVEYMIISEEEYKEALAKKKKREEEKAKQTERENERKRQRYIKINIGKFNDSLTELTKDLQEKLLDGEIEPKKFFNIYYKLSFNLYKKYKRVLDNYDLSLDMSDFRYTIKKVADNILELGKFQEKSEEYLDSLDDEIENDELYIEEQNEYINDSDVFDIDSQDYQEQQYINDERLKDLKRKIKVRDREEKREAIKLEKQERIANKKYTDRIDDYTKSININNKK